MSIKEISKVTWWSIFKPYKYRLFWHYRNTGMSEKASFDFIKYKGNKYSKLLLKALSK